MAFVDIGLPELNGYEVAKRIRKQQGNDEVYLVALTGHGQPTDREATCDAGFDEHMTKPIDMCRLNELLTDISSRRISEQRLG